MNLKETTGFKSVSISTQAFSRKEIFKSFLFEMSYSSSSLSEVFAKLCS